MRFADQEVSPGIGYNNWAMTDAGKKSEEGQNIVSDENGARMSFLDHLGELRSRLLHAVIAILIAFLGCLVFAERVFGILAAPLTKLLLSSQRFRIHSSFT